MLEKKTGAKRYFLSKSPSKNPLRLSSDFEENPSQVLKKFVLASLGCRTNHYETQSYRAQLVHLGLTEASSEQEADLCIVNTCTVTASADVHSRRQIRQIAKQHPKAQIWVTGCLAERDPEGILKLPRVRAVVSNLTKERLLDCIFPERVIPSFKIEAFEGRTRGFVKVQDGCNSFCSYCIIPYVRGRSRSKTVQEVVDEVQGLVRSGVKEIVLTGINVGDYDGGVLEGEEPVSLAQLMQSVDQVEGLQRLRLSSIDPDEVDDALIEAILKGKNTTKSMHIVLQSGANPILKRMRRKYTRQMFLQSCRRLKEAHPEFTFTTDVIVGFPGETQEDFEQTVDIIEKVGFAKVHMFPYSKREGTKAARFDDEVEPEVIAQRKRILIEKAEKSAFRERQPYVGKRMKVLIESHFDAKQDQNAEDRAEKLYAGYSDHFFFVKVGSSSCLEANEMVEVEIVRNDPDGLFARVLPSSNTLSEQ